MKIEMIMKLYSQVCKHSFKEAGHPPCLSGGTLEAAVQSRDNQCYCLGVFDKENKNSVSSLYNWPEEFFSKKLFKN